MKLYLSVMKALVKPFALASLLLFASPTLTGQEQREAQLLSTAPKLRANYIGSGGLFLKDTYLSPLNYGGVLLSYQGEMLERRYRAKGLGGLLFGKRIPLESQSSWQRSQFFSLDLGTTSNPAQNASILRFQLRWETARLYQVGAGEWGSLALGPSWTIGAGALYSTRNGNNPTSLKLDSSLGLALYYTYEVPWQDFPLRFRLSTRTDLLGLQWSQHYGESFYELYMLSKDYAKRLHLLPIGRQWGQEVRLALDLPLLRYADLSVSYRLRHRSWEANSLRTSLSDHTFFLGLVRYLSTVSRGASRDLYRVPLL